MVMLAEAKPLASPSLENLWRIPQDPGAVTNLYVGNAYDPAAKLHGFHVRWYDPGWGAF
jgi:hypothetical protein